MNYNELAKKVHENAVLKGFWDKEQSVNHYLMLVLRVSVIMSRNIV